MIIGSPVFLYFANYRNSDASSVGSQVDLIAARVDRASPSEVKIALFRSLSEAERCRALSAAPTASSRL
jgi:hypothetical protein